MNQPLTAAVRFLSGEREPVRVATTGNITLQGLLVIDDVELEVGDRVLVKDQTDQKQNGIWLASEGKWPRAPDASYTRAIDAGVTVAVKEGTAGNGKTYRFGSVNPVVGVDPITLTYFLSETISDDISDAAAAAVEEVATPLVAAAEAAAGRAESAAAGLENASSYPTKSAAELLDLSSPPDAVRVLGYNAPSDGGGAIYVSPEAGVATKSDQLTIHIDGSPFAYNRLHEAGEVDFAKHGLFLDGREEVTRFEDAFAVALDRGLNRLVMPGGRSVELVGAVLPEASFHVDFRGSTILGNFNDSVAGATDRMLVCNMMQGVGTLIGDMTAGGGLAAAFDGVKNVITANCATKAATSGYAGKTFSSPRRIFRATVYGSNGAGYISATNPTVNLYLYAKTGAAPTSDADGTLLASLSFTDTNDESATPRELVSNDKVTGWDHVWVRVASGDGTGSAVRIADIRLEGAAPAFNLTLANWSADGGNVDAVAKLAERTGIDVEGYNQFRLINGAMRNFARGGSTPTLILDREVQHTRIHNNLDVIVDGYWCDSNVTTEEFVIQSTDEITRYLIQNCQTTRKVGSGSGFSVYYCGPGRVINNYVSRTTGSCINILSRFAEIAFNRLEGSEGSHVLDVSEGLIYSHGTRIHNNTIGQAGVAIGGNAITGCGNDLRIEDNRILGNCENAVNVQTALNGTGDYGSWCDIVQQDISGVKIKGNRSEQGHNAEPSDHNSNVRIVGSTGTTIEYEIAFADDAYPATKTEHSAWLRRAKGKIRGRLMHGRDSLVYIDGDCEVEFDGATLAPESGQGVDGVYVAGGTDVKIVFNNVKDAGSFDGGTYHVNRITGTITEIQVNNSPTIDEFSLAANTRVLRDGRIYKAATPFAITGSLTAGGRLSGTLAVPGVRVATDEVLQCVNVSNSSIIAAAYVSGDNEVTVVYWNPTSSTITNPSANLRIMVGTRGQSV